MAIEIKTTNNKELWQKKRDYLAALRKSTRQPSASIEELCVLAHSGMLDKSERAVCLEDRNGSGVVSLW